MITNYNGIGVSESITDIYRTFVEEYSHINDKRKNKKALWKKAKKHFKQLKKERNQ
jgi:metal-responsive CopG/Arc/MetJ family transcriptional regulator